MSLDQWFNFGKEFNHTLYENSILGSGKYFENYKKAQVTKETIDREIKKMEILNLVLPEKKLRQCDKYLFVDDILPCTTQPILSNVAPAMDLQALDLATKEICNISFNEELINDFVSSNNVENSFDLAALDVIVGLCGVKQILTSRDWMVLRDLYVEFKVTGIIKVQKVCTAVLEMMPRTSQVFRPMARVASPAKMLSALKFGTLLLNLFHFCYSDAIKLVQKSNQMHWNEVEPNLISGRHLSILTESNVDLIRTAKGDTAAKQTKLTNQSNNDHASKQLKKQQGPNKKVPMTKKASHVEPGSVRAGNKSSLVPAFRNNKKKSVKKVNSKVRVKK